MTDLPIRVLSIPHSGTRFVKTLLKGWGVRHRLRHTIEIETDCIASDDGGSETWKAVVPHMDPMFTEISRARRAGKGEYGFGHEFDRPGLLVKQWLRLAKLRGNPNVHFFRIPPDEADVKKLADFCGLDRVLHWNQEPVGVWPEENVLKARYLRGDVDEVLLPTWEWLKDLPEMHDFFSWLGYDDLPWMVEA